LTDPTLRETFLLSLNSLFLYVVPIIAAVKLFGVTEGMYKKPRSFSKVLSYFPAMYGLGQIVNILTWVAVWLIALLSGNDSSATVNNMMNLQKTATPSAALILSAYTVVVAPVCEELLTRGLIMRSLKPYGAGFSIVISAMVFGMMHVNPRQMPYAFVLGLALGYISHTTGSILTTTVLHAIFNGTSMIFIFLQSLRNATPRTDGEDLINSLYMGYIAIMFSLVLLGFAAFFRKIPEIRNIKRRDFRLTYPLTSTQKSAALIKSPLVLAGIAAFLLNVGISG
jgi:membrane protease YdiL (CAAX protease family)